MALTSTALGLAVGWAAGILAAPYESERRRFKKIGGVVAAFITGFAVSKVDSIFALWIDPARGPMIGRVRVPRRLVKSCLRQTAAWAGGRRGRSARCGGGSPDSAGGARVRPRACGDGCVGGSALRRGPRVSDDRRCRTSRRTATRRRRSHPAASY